MAKEKTININVGYIEKEMADITFDEFAKRWRDHAKQLHKLCWCDSREAFETNRQTLEQIEKLVDQMIEIAFNDEYEKQQKKKVAV
jgi:hypothetical protein